MRRLKFLLRPGWIALVLAVIIFSGACFWLLSPWQFGRNSQREAENNAITTAEHTSVVPVETLLPNGATPTAAQQWRLVSMSGHYLPAAETVARLRVVSGQPAYEVLTPFRLDNGQTLLVDRGWVAPNNGALPSYPAAPSGHVSLQARVQSDEPDPHRAPLTENGHREIYAVNTSIVTRLTGLTFSPGYFTLIDNQPGSLTALPLPQLDSGPFFSYALQWICFGVMALFGLGYFTRREIQPGGALTPEGRAQRRADRSRQEAEAARTGTPAPQRKVRGRHAVAALIAEDEARERAEAQQAEARESRSDEPAHT